VAGLIEQAVMDVLKEGRTLTYDLVDEERAARCSAVGEAVKSRLEQRFARERI
jgi:hypothetical protein